MEVGERLPLFSSEDVMSTLITVKSADHANLRAPLTMSYVAPDRRHSRTQTPFNLLLGTSVNLKAHRWATLVPYPA
jgi:hypothetical protein